MDTLTVQQLAEVLQEANTALLGVTHDSSF